MKTAAIDIDFAACACPPVPHHTGIACLQAEVLPETRTSPGGGHRYALRCLQCSIRWLVWHTEGPKVFWPSAYTERVRARKWPPGCTEIGPVLTENGAFLARRAVLPDEAKMQRFSTREGPRQGTSKGPWEPSEPVELAPRQRDALRHLLNLHVQERECVTAHAVATLMGIIPRGAHRHLRRLADFGLVKEDVGGCGRASYYAPTKKGLAYPLTKQ